MCTQASVFVSISVIYSIAAGQHCQPYRRDHVWRRARPLSICVCALPRTLVRRAAALKWRTPAERVCASAHNIHFIYQMRTGNIERTSRRICMRITLTPPLPPTGRIHDPRIDSAPVCGIAPALYSLIFTIKTHTRVLSPFVGCVFSPISTARLAFLRLCDRSLPCKPQLRARQMDDVCAHCWAPICPSFEHVLTDSHWRHCHRWHWGRGRTVGGRWAVVAAVR